MTDNTYFSRVALSACCVLLLISVFSASVSAQGQVMDITVDLSGIPAGTSLATRAGIRNAFLDAEKFWESRLIGFSGQLPPAVLRTVKPIKISATIEAVDGPGGILGFAGPDRFLTYNGRRPIVIAQESIMVFDEADAIDFQNQGLFDDIVRHEMAHAIGFGTTWTQNRVNLGPGGNFTGPFALKRFRLEARQPFATSVPVEQGGGAGTAGGHWDSQTPFFFNGQSNIGDLMIGFITDAPQVSETTWSSFADVWFKVKGINDTLTSPPPGGGGGPRTSPATRSTATN